MWPDASRIMRSEISEKTAAGTNFPPHAPHNRGLRIIAEVYRFGRHHHPDRTRRTDHRLAFCAWTIDAIIVGSAPLAGPDRDAVNFDLDDPGIHPGLAAHRFALTPKSGRRHYGIHHRRHKLYARRFSQLTAPAKQLLRRQSMPSRYRADRIATRHDLRENPCLVLVAPLPPTAGSGEDLEPPHWLRDSSMHCVHSKPNGPNRSRLGDHPVGGAQQRLQFGKGHSIGLKSGPYGGRWSRLAPTAWMAFRTP
ncbi:hypothetical protein ACVWZM_004576 [Bradyrhizobium sp. USDA 4501]